MGNNWFDLPLEERQAWILEQEKRKGEMTPRERQEFLARQSVTPINRVALINEKHRLEGTQTEWIDNGDEADFLEMLGQ